MTSNDETKPYDFIYSPELFADADQVASVRVPIYRATPEALVGYGQLVSDYEAEKVTRVTWPKSTGWRKVASGSGNQQSILEGDFRLRWNGDVLYGDNVAFGEIGMGFVTGRLSKDRRHVLVREANYHPDGSQVFFPSTPGDAPYVMLLALASVGDDVTPTDFRAFWFDGECGFNIAPGVWHSSPFPRPPSTDDETTSDDASGMAVAVDGSSISSSSSTTVYRNKQSSVFACVLIDTVGECGVYLEVPLELAE